MGFVVTWERALGKSMCSTFCGTKSGEPVFVFRFSAEYIRTSVRTTKYLSCFHQPLREIRLDITERGRASQTEHRLAAICYL